MTSQPTPLPLKPRSLKKFWGIVISIVVGMAAMAFYMSTLIRVVPKTISNSRAGIFVTFADQLIRSYEGPALAHTGDLDGLNALIRSDFSESPWQIKPEGPWQLESWSFDRLEGRPLLLAKYRHLSDGSPLLLASVPMTKRNFPKTGGFSYKDAWFFTFGKEQNRAVREDHQVEVSALEEKNLNLVATNYGNDIYIVMLSPKPSRQLAEELFAISTIFPPDP